MTWATSVPILVFLDLSVLDLGPMYATDRQTDVRQTSDVRQKHRLMPRLLGAGHSKLYVLLKAQRVSLHAFIYPLHVYNQNKL